jgi:hypothetical protein
VTLVELVETEVTPFAGSTGFGAVGPYELVRGHAVIALDPTHPANARLTDIDRAQRGPDGRVGLRSDVMVLRPVERARANGGLLSVVPNRGGTGGVPFAVAQRAAIGEGLALDPGDGWPLRHGWTIAWAGWQFDIPSGLLGCEVPPVVDADDRPLAGTVRVVVQPAMPVTSIALRSSAAFYPGVPYPAADADHLDAQLDAQLWRSPGRGRPGRLVRRADWCFGREVEDRVVPDPRRLWLRDGLRPDEVYELHYRTGACPFVGGGLAAFRDVMGHLRRDLAFSVAVGRSQSGRFLRELLWCGLNVDERGQAVFDAVIPFIAGASRGEFNQRYGQPAEALAAGVGHRPPYDLDALLARQRAVGGVPKVVLVNSASEYWRADASLSHVSLDGRRDLASPAGTREYLLASTEHVGGADLGRPLPDPHRAWLAATVLHRAILELVRRWIVDGAEPPPSVLPRVADGTAVDRASVLEAFSRFGLPRLPRPDQLPGRYELDLGPLADAGQPTYPAWFGPGLPAYVSAVDDDGNEIAGIRHPEVSVPLATHTGWTTLLAEGARWESLSFLVGNSHPFAVTSEDRAPDDRRPTIAERYPSREHYRSAVRAAAQALVGDGFLLAEDVESVVETASAAYDRQVAKPKE